MRWLVAALVAFVHLDSPPAAETVVRVSIAGRVATLELEDYVARVVAAEGQPKAPDAAQQALAITARTYALANRNRHRRAGYDLCDTTHCQVLRPATEASRRAARASAGRVLLQGTVPASVYYSAHCGGHSELASQVWPGADDASSHLHEDDACRDQPAWSVSIPTATLERALRAAGHRGSRLRELRVIARNESGRVTRLGVTGFTPSDVSGQDLRMAINRVAAAPLLRSTAFDLAGESGGYRFRGTGYGHGVGLCVIGAGRRAEMGRSADAILDFYFPNLRVGVYDASARPAPRAAVTSTTREAVVVNIGRAEERERDAIVALVSAARDDLARATGRTPGAPLHVTVHPTIDAFVRGTGQPWWKSGSADGTRIDLVPVTLLRQRGQLESAIRQYVAHTLIDEVLDGRPLWVREGAAAYFADPTGGPGADNRRGNCPRDEELSRPVSAGAYRAALERASACFRRAIGRGVNWTQVR